MYTVSSRETPGVLGNYLVGVDTILLASPRRNSVYRLCAKLAKPMRILVEFNQTQLRIQNVEIFTGQGLSILIATQKSFTG